MLVGRAQECRRLDEVLEGAQQGRGGALVISGDPGIGKTSLLDYATRCAPDMRIVRARGVETEASLPFGALADIVKPLAGSLSDLPERQAEALASALAIGPSLPADRLAVLVGALNLMCACAGERPLLVVVDDGHWVDPASAEAIAFASRRVGADPIAILIATRSAGPAGVPVLRPRPLTADECHELLDQRGLRPADLADTLRTAAGNPLALIDLAGQDRHPGQPSRSALEDTYARMVEVLPDACREALLLLACAPASSPPVLKRALAARGLTDAAFAPAERSGLVTLDPARLAFGFRHPLIRSAVYTASPGPERRRAHDTLAEAHVEPGQELERTAHRAAAATEPDEDLAAALERGAADIRLRGGTVSAVEWHRRSGALSVDRKARMRRLLAAAEGAHASGDGRLAQEILAELEDDCVEAEDTARVELLRGRIEARSGSTLAASARVLAAAERLKAIDPRAATVLFIEAVDPSIRAGRPGQALEAARRALELAPPGDVLELEARIARAASLTFLGDARRADADIEAVAADLAAMPALRADLELRAYLGMTLGFAERIDRATATLDELIDECEQSAPGALTYPLISRSWVRRITGEWAGAQADAQRAVRLARQLGRAADECWGLSILTWIGAARGRLDAELLESQRSLSDRLDLPYQRMGVHASLGQRALAAGDASEAAAELAAAIAIKRECGIEDATSQPVIGADLVEALVRCGRADEAGREAAALESAADRAGRQSARALAARAAALIAGEGSDLFARAAELHTHASDPFAGARTALAWGDSLRRAGRRIDARRLLEEARTGFERLAAAPWEQQAESALARSGRVLRREPARRDELTPAEVEVASLVAEGKTNREIAGALWMSEKTVEAHLSRIYRKLGVRNRVELAGRRPAVPGVGADPAPAPGA